MDTRGQGTSATGGHGATPDPVGAGVAAPGTLTRGVEDPHDHYYRRVFTDAVRAVEAVRELPGVDPARVAVTGVSQGGAPSTVYASANHYGGAVTVEVYPFNEHEGGTEFQRERQLTWLAQRLKP